MQITISHPLIPRASFCRAGAETWIDAVGFTFETMNFDTMQLVKRGWKSPDTYDVYFADPPRASGIYCIIEAEVYINHTFEVAYVGMSTNLRKRLCSSHKAINCIRQNGFSAFRFFIEVNASDLRQAELEAIREFQPKLNVLGLKGAIQ